MRHRYSGGEDLTGLRLDELVHPVGTEPLGHDHEQRPAVLAAEHAGVARTVDLDAVEDLAALADALNDVSSVRADGAAPDGTLGVDTDPVARDGSPDAPVREASVGGDVEGGEPSGEG